MSCYSKLLAAAAAAAAAAAVDGKDEVDWESSRYGEGVTSASICGLEGNTLCAIVADARGSSCIRCAMRV